MLCKYYQYYICNFHAEISYETKKFKQQLGSFCSSSTCKENVIRENVKKVLINIILSISKCLLANKEIHLNVLEDLTVTEKFIMFIISNEI